MTLKEWWKRWRATRGYGVHSPLAFRIVKNAVRPPRDVVYYGEERLDFFEESGKKGKKVHPDFHTLRQAKFLLRLVAELQPAYVWLSPKLPMVFREAVSLAGCVVRIFDGKLFPTELDNSDMAVLYFDRIKKKDLQKFLRPGHSLIGFGLSRSFMDSVKSAMPGGIILEGTDSIVAVATPDPAVHSYRLLLP